MVKNPLKHFLILTFTLGSYSILWLPNIAEDINKISSGKAVNFFYIRTYQVVFLINILLFLIIFILFLCVFSTQSSEVERFLSSFIILILIGNILGVISFFFNILLLVKTTLAMQNLFKNHKINKEPNLLIVLLFNFLWLLSLPYLQSKLNYFIQIQEGQNEKKFH